MATNRATKRLKVEIFAFLASDEFKNWTIIFSHKSLTESSKHYAEVDIDNKIITVNPLKPFTECLLSIIHEILHILRPRSYEKTIRRWEHDIAEQMSPLETTSLISAVFSGKVIWDN